MIYIYKDFEKGQVIVKEKCTPEQALVGIIKQLDSRTLLYLVRADEMRELIPEPLTDELWRRIANSYSGETFQVRVVEEYDGERYNLLLAIIKKGYEIPKTDTLINIFQIRSTHP